MAKWRDRLTYMTMDDAMRTKHTNVSVDIFI